ncbi:hypothetical protein [Pseudoduganella violacea]|uniref:Uncharacterized protein n=1 Tax=Pseudoduganella violacea TaxID=1715466 RepID=A0A7W5FT98_9BURK|nr:hypothetical protein [Pseudoduganella violacea]MBB3118356.1 hypothetical protein [Pseudoduganella violacea]
MQKKDVKSFAFKLAAKKEESKSGAQWKVRDGVAVAGCSGQVDPRYVQAGNAKIRDEGWYC